MKNLPRVLCIECGGIGGDPLSDECPFCQASPSSWCHVHKCQTCSGRGTVCPECRGMRFHSSGIGKMQPTMKATKEHRQMANTAVHHCDKCMHYIDNKPTLSLSREADVIDAYIRDPHNAYWSVRDEQDRQREEHEARMRDAKPWRSDWGKQRALVPAEPMPEQIQRELAEISKVVWPAVYRDRAGVVVREAKS